MYRTIFLFPTELFRVKTKMEIPEGKAKLGRAARAKYAGARGEHQKALQLFGELRARNVPKNDPKDAISNSGTSDAKNAANVKKGVKDRDDDEDEDGEDGKGGEEDGKEDEEEEEEEDKDKGEGSAKEKVPTDALQGQ
jgi:hypothetical protein